MRSRAAARLQLAGGWDTYVRWPVAHTRRPRRALLPGARSLAEAGVCRGRYAPPHTVCGRVVAPVLVQWRAHWCFAVCRGTAGLARGVLVDSPRAHRHWANSGRGVGGKCVGDGSATNARGVSAPDHTIVPLRVRGVGCAAECHAAHGTPRHRGGGGVRACGWVGRWAGGVCVCARARARARVEGERGAWAWSGVLAVLCDQVMRRHR